MKVGITVCIILMSLFCLCLLTSLGEASDTIKVGAIFATTGNAAPSNVLHLQGVRIAVAELNAQGGVLGKKIELIEIDNASTEIGSKLAAKQAIKQQFVAVIGASWSSHSLAMAPLLQKAHIPMISPVSTNPRLTHIGEYIFRVCFTDAFQGSVMAQFAIQDLHAKSAAVLTNTGNQYSLQLSQVFIEQFQQRDGEILLEADYLQEATDFTSQLAQIISLQPDVVFVPGYERDSAYIIKQARNMGLTMPFLGGDGWGTLMFDEKYAVPEAYGNYCSSHWHQDSRSQKNQEFMKKYTATHSTVESGGIPLAYDAVMLLSDAVQRANSLNPEDIRDALALTKNFEGVTGTITLDEYGDPTKSGVILKLSNGTWEFVRTIEP